MSTLLVSAACTFTVPIVDFTVSEPPGLTGNDFLIVSVILVCSLIWLAKTPFVFSGKIFLRGPFSCECTTATQAMLSNRMVTRKALPKNDLTGNTSLPYVSVQPALELNQHAAALSRGCV